MKCLVIVTHPSKGSFVATLAQGAVDEARAIGHEVKVTDLYGENFIPVMTAHERQSLHSGYDYSAVSQQAADLQWAEILVLVFPTWWFNFPAILKGWFDRVWVPGIAYDQTSAGGPLVPRLNQLKKVFVVTTLGSPWWVDWLVLRRPLRRLMKTAILHTCAPRSTLIFKSFYSSDNLDTEAVAEAVKIVRLAVAKL